MNIKLTKEQIKNLLIFLQRTSLKGQEVDAFVQIVRVITEAVSKDKKKDLNK